MNQPVNTPATATPAAVAATPAQAPVAPEQVAATPVAAKVAATVQAAEGEAAAKPAKATKSEKAEKTAEPKVERERNEKANGVVRPAPDTKTGKVWSIADEMTKEQGTPAKRKDVLNECDAHGIAASTAATQYGRWRKFNGLEGRGDAEETAAKAEKPAKQTKAQKEAAAAEKPTATVVE